MRLPKRKDEFDIYLNKTARVYGANGKDGLGKISKITPRGMYLQPYLADEHLYNEEGYLVHRARIEEKIPHFIGSVQNIEPVKDSYLEKLVKSLNKIKYFKKPKKSKELKS